MKLNYILFFIVFSSCSKVEALIDNPQFLIANSADVGDFIITKNLGTTRRVFDFPDTLKPQCQHVYVAVEQPEVKMPIISNSTISVYVAPPSGRHEGKEIVCLKCHHVRKQIMDYGAALILSPRARITDGGGTLALPADWKKLIDSTGKFVMGSTLLNAPYPEEQIWIEGSGPTGFTQLSFPISKDWGDGQNMIRTKDAVYDKLKRLSDKKKKRRGK